MRLAVAELSMGRSGALAGALEPLAPEGKRRSDCEEQPRARRRIRSETAEEKPGADAEKSRPETWSEAAERRSSDDGRDEKQRIVTTEGLACQKAGRNACNGECERGGRPSPGKREKRGCFQVHFLTLAAPLPTTAYGIVPRGFS